MRFRHTACTKRQKMFSGTRSRTCLTYTGHRGSQHRGQTVTSPSKPYKAPHTAERQKQNSQVQRASSQQAAASSTVSKIIKGPSKALNRYLWGHRGPRHSRHHSRHVHTQGRRSSRISGHMSQHMAKVSQGTSAGRSPPATYQSACEWHTTRAGAVAAPARSVDTRSQSSRTALAIQAAAAQPLQRLRKPDHWPPCMQLRPSQLDGSF